MIKKIFFIFFTFFFLINQNWANDIINSNDYFNIFSLGKNARDQLQEELNALAFDLKTKEYNTIIIPEMACASSYYSLQCDFYQEVFKTLLAHGKLDKIKKIKFNYLITLNQQDINGMDAYNQLISFLNNVNLKNLVRLDFSYTCWNNQTLLTLLNDIPDQITYLNLAYCSVTSPLLFLSHLDSRPQLKINFDHNPIDFKEKFLMWWKKMPRIVQE